MIAHTQNQRTQWPPRPSRTLSFYPRLESLNESRKDPAVDETHRLDSSQIDIAATSTAANEPGQLETRLLTTRACLIQITKRLPRAHLGKNKIKLMEGVEWFSVFGISGRSTGQEKNAPLPSTTATYDVRAASDPENEAHGCSSEKFDDLAGTGKSTPFPANGRRACAAECDQQDSTRYHLQSSSLTTTFPLPRTPSTQLLPSFGPNCPPGRTSQSLLQSLPDSFRAQRSRKCA